MPVPEMISVAEYLQTNHHPDREFVDGELVERAPCAGQFHAISGARPLHYRS